MLNFKMRLYPTAAQEKRLEEVLDVNPFLYNYFVKRGFKDRNDMNYALTEMKEQYPILKNHYGKMLQMVSTKVAAANSALNSLKKKGRKSGKAGLRLLETGECRSFVYNQKGYRIEQLGEGNKHLLHLSKLGSIEIRVHR